MLLLFLVENYLGCNLKNFFFFLFSKGSIFAVFDSIESAKMFVETPGQKYKDTDLLILFKEDYFTKKSEERKQNKIEAKLRAKQ